MVGGAGIEPATPSMSRKCSPAELTAQMTNQGDPLCRIAGGQGCACNVAVIAGSSRSPGAQHLGEQYPIGRGHVLPQRFGHPPARRRQFSTGGAARYPQNG